MKSTKIFAFYTLLFALIGVGVISGFSNAASDSSFFSADIGGTVPTRVPDSGGTVPTRVPGGGTVPTRIPDSGGTVPTRVPGGGTIPTRVPDSGTIPTRTPDSQSATADDSQTDNGNGTVSNSGGQGSMIVLHSSSADGDDWVVVEWLAGDGNWYQVDGWRGNIHNGSLTWWVAKQNLGQGPFRWVVYSDQTETTMLATSDPFHLPDFENGVKSFSLDW